MTTPVTWTRYDGYKESGVDWIGRIPKHWEQLANKRIFRLRKTLVGKQSSEHELLSLTLRGIVKRDMENPEGKFPAEFDTYQKVRPGDFVFCHFDVEETPRTVGLSEHFGMITGAYTVYSVPNGVDSRFLLYFFTCADTDKKMRSLYKGLRNTIPKDVFGAFKTPLPPIEEQRIIAKFLDDKCAKVDEAVRIKEEQIALLRERRQILIQDAVTRGLNPDAPMKDSGIDWVGPIPSHWEVLPLKFIARLKSGETISSEQFTCEGFPVFGGNGFRGYTDRYTHEGDYILIGRQGALCGNVNYASGRFFASEHAVVATPQVQANIFWLGELIRSANLNRLSQSAAQPGLSVEVVGNQRFPYAPYAEQVEIGNYIGDIANSLDAGIALKSDQIAALKEYKTTLINAAVTGKIKVA